MGFNDSDFYTDEEENTSLKKSLFNKKNDKKSNINNDTNNKSNEKQNTSLEDKLYEEANTFEYQEVELPSERKKRLKEEKKKRKLEQKQQELKIKEEKSKKQEENISYDNNNFEYQEVDMPKQKKQRNKDKTFNEPQPEEFTETDTVDYEDKGFKKYIKKYRRSKFFWPTMIFLILLLLAVLIFRSYAFKEGTLTDISIDDISKIYVGERTLVNANATGNGNLRNTSFYYSNTNNSIVEIETKGELKGKKVTNTLIPLAPGKFMLTVKASLNGIEKTKNNQVIICKRLKDAINYKEMSVDLKNEFSVNLNLGEDECYNTLKYEVDDDSIIKVSNGKITGLKEGTTTLKIIDENDQMSIKVKAVKEIVPTTGISVDKDEIKIEVASTYKINASIMPKNATLDTLLWKSSDTSIVTVDSTGVVKGLAIGDAIVTVSTQDEKYKKDIKVIVTDKKGDEATTQKPELSNVTISTNNKVNNKYAKLNDSITISMTFNKNLSEKPQVELNGNILMVTGDGKTYKATTTVTSSMKEGKPSIKISGYKDEKNVSGQSITSISNNITIDKTNPTCTLKNTSGLLTITGKDSNGIHGYVIDRNKDTTSGFTSDKEIRTTVNGTYYGHVQDNAGNIGTCQITVNNNTNDKQKPVVLKAYLYSNNRYNTSYAKAGDTVYLDITFNEMINNTPTVTLSDMKSEVIKTGTNTYRATLIVNDKSKNGKITINISNYQDLSGNKGDNVTKLTQGEVTIDTQSPVCLWNGPFSDDYKTSKTYVKNGDYAFYKLTCVEKNPLRNEVDNGAIQINNNSLITGFNLMNKENDGINHIYYFRVSIGNGTGKAYLRLLSNVVIDSAGNISMGANSPEVVKR